MANASAGAPARAPNAHRDPWLIAPPLEVHVAEHEMADPSCSVVAIEAVAVVEPDVAEQRDLHAEPDARAHLEPERLDLGPLVPDIAGIEEKHTVQRVGNRELLLEREQREVTASGVTDSRHPR